MAWPVADIIVVVASGCVLGVVRGHGPRVLREKARNASWALISFICIAIDHLWLSLLQFFILFNLLLPQTVVAFGALA